MKNLTGNDFMLIGIGILIAIMLLIVIFYYPEYKLNKKKLQRRKINETRFNEPAVTQNNTSIVNGFFYLLTILVFCFLVFLFFRYMIKKVCSAIEELIQAQGINIPKYVWVTAIVLLAGSIIWYLRDKITKKASSLISADFKQKWFKWNNVFSALLLFGLGVFVYYQVTKPKDPGPQQTPWIAVKSPVSNQIFDLEKQNKMTPGNPLGFEQKDPEVMLHFAPTSDTVVYTIVKKEDRSRYWSVMVWTKGDTLFENRLTTPEPYDKAKVGDSEISVDRPSTIVVWKKKVVVL